MIKKIIILIAVLFSISSAFAKNEIEISRCDISAVSSSKFSLNYQIKNTFDPETISKLQVVLPFEQYILQGTIENGFIIEKDILFSQLNIDLNSDKDPDDQFKAKIQNKILNIDNVQIYPVIKHSANYQALIPFDEKGNQNLNRISKNGLPFTLRNLSSKPAEITIGISSSGEIEFRKLPNSELLIEIITSDKNAGDTLLIDGQKPVAGYTNEKDLTNGENLSRFTAVKHIPVNNNEAKGSLIISDINRPCLLRITYYCGISESLILFSQKIIRVN